LLEDRIDEIENLASLPLGLESELARLPWIAPRYETGMKTLEIGRLLSQSGQTIADVGEEAITALDGTGVRFDPANDEATWLDVIHQREPELYSALDQIDEAMVLRSSIDESYLPERIVNRLNHVDGVIDQFSEQLELADDLPLAYEALGAEEPKRYLVLFQNPAELRPTGGFVGTIAELELHRGQISSYEFHDVYELSRDYQMQGELAVDPPWAIREYVRPDDLQIQDANWWPHFPTTAKLLMAMTEAAGWSSLDGVVAVQPETIQQLITVTGPIVVDVDGEDREITAENLHDEAERQRRIVREGGEAETGHKEVIELISEILVDELSTGDRDSLIESVFLLFESFDRRDMQVYHDDDGVQVFLEERNWAGLEEPEPAAPTLSAVFANITGLKTSFVMQPDFELQLLESSTDEVQEAILTIGLNHQGAEEGDPFYEGFQRWWVDIALPEGSVLVDTMPEVADDPDASSGGAYVVNLDVGEREEIAVKFTMPGSERLLIRRQPGLLTMTGTIRQQGCDEAVELQVDRDQVLLFDDSCVTVEYPPEVE
jgi:hypothetical protein